MTRANVTDNRTRREQLTERHGHANEQNRRFAIVHVGEDFKRLNLKWECRLPGSTVCWQSTLYRSIDENRERVRGKSKRERQRQRRNNIEALVYTRQNERFISRNNWICTYSLFYDTHIAREREIGRKSTGETYWLELWRRKKVKSELLQRTLNFLLCSFTRISIYLWYCLKKDWQVRGLFSTNN